MIKCVIDGSPPKGLQGLVTPVWSAGDTHLLETRVTGGHWPIAGP